MDPTPPRVHPQQALAVYIEPLAVGRRVAVLGDASLGLATRIAELGARSVCVWDPDAERARLEATRAPPGVIVRPLPPDGMLSHFGQPTLEAQSLSPRRGPVAEDDEQSGAFDVAIVADLELFDDAEELLAQVRRLVGDEGVALVVAANREGTGHSTAFDYYELFDLVAREFADVTMIAQLPFFGVALAELREEDDQSPTVSVDTQLADVDRTPEAFVALASQHGVRLDPYAIVELTPQRWAPEIAPDDEGARAALVQAQLRGEALEAQLGDLRARCAVAERDAGAVQQLEEALREGSSRAAELEGALAERTRQLVLSSEEMQRVRAASEPVVARLADAHAAEIAGYEEALRDRALVTRQLEAELVRRERMVHELVDVLEENARTGAAAPSGEEDGSTERDALVEENAELRHKLDALALELARREGEAQATGWTIAELERRLEVGPLPQAAVDRELAAALDEVDVLRRALAQEHEARTRAEAGEKTTAARSAPQRQD